MAHLYFDEDFGATNALSFTPSPPPVRRSGHPADARQSKRKRDTSLPAPSSTTLTEEEVIKAEQRSPVPDEAPPRKRRIKREECVSCCVDVPANQFPKRPHTGSTTSCRACLSCWCQHLHSQLESLDHDKLSCSGCERVLSTQEIMDIQARFKRKDRVEPKLQAKAIMAFLRSQPDFVSCPSSTCKDGASMADGNIFTCRTCQYRYCFDCNVAFHEDEGCQEFQDRIQEDERRTLEIAQSLELLNTTTKPCPECKAPIEKRGGCEHMSCTKCRHQFCWLCFAKWTDIMRDGNSMHAEECKFYAPDTAPAPAYNGQF